MPGARRPGSRSPTATVRPRPGIWPATSTAPRSGRARWASPFPDSSCGSSTRSSRSGSSSCPTFFSRYLDCDPYAGEWWSTGDVVREDADGYLWYEGRDDDLILSAGYRIGPFEVESALLTHPSVAEAAAVAAPDPERGSVVRAIVVLREGEPLR